MSVLIEVVDGGMQQRVRNCLLPGLTMWCNVSFRGLHNIDDGVYQAHYEGRGAHRDVYVVANKWVIKLHKHSQSWNASEAEALKACTGVYFVRLLHQGAAIMQGTSSRVAIDVLVCDYGGLTIGKIVERQIQMELDAVFVDFICTFYKNCMLMCLEAKEQGFMFLNLHRGNLATLANADGHVIGGEVKPIIIDAECCDVSVWNRASFNKACDQLLSDLAIHCDLSQCESWQHFGCIWSKKMGLLFQSYGDVPVDIMRQKCMEAIRDVQFEYSNLLPERYADKLLRLAEIQRMYQMSGASTSVVPDARSSTIVRSQDTYGELRHASSLPIGCKPAETFPVAPGRLLPIGAKPQGAAGRFSYAPARSVLIGARPKAASAEHVLYNGQLYGVMKQEVPMAPPPKRMKVQHEPWSATASPERYAVALSSQPSLPVYPLNANYNSDLAIVVADEGSPLLEEAGQTELRKQLLLKYRGEGRFLEDRPDRLAWEDRQVADCWEHVPVMSRTESDDVARFLYIMYVALKDLLAEVPLNIRGKKQRRVTSYSEFTKYGMHKRVFQSIKWFSTQLGEWFSPAAAFYTILEEFKLLEGYYDKKYSISGFHFRDEYHKHKVAREIVVSYLAVGSTHVQFV